MEQNKKATPGPWLPRPLGHTMQLVDNDGKEIGVFGGRDKHFAMEPSFQTQANAILASAAHDLLGVCEAFLDGMVGTAAEGSMAWMQAASAYQKATGKAYNIHKLHGHKALLNTGYDDGCGTRIMWPGQVKTLSNNKEYLFDIRRIEVGVSNRDMVGHQYSAGGYPLNAIFFVGAGKEFKYVPYGQTLDTEV